MIIINFLLNPVRLVPSSETPPKSDGVYFILSWFIYLSHNLMIIINVVLNPVRAVMSSVLSLFIYLSYNLIIVINFVLNPVRLVPSPEKTAPKPACQQ